MTSPLPLQVRVGIRDYWDKEDGALKKAVASLEEILGYKIVMEPQWQLLLADLGKVFPDKAQFVACVSACVESWCNSLVGLLDGQASEDWTETLLQKLVDRHPRLELFLEGGPFIPWREPDSLGRNLLTCFEAKSHAALPHHKRIMEIDDWADVEVGEATGGIDVVEKQPPQSVAEVDYLPKVDLLPRPDELLLKPPYHLVVDATGRAEVEIQCSHSPSLQFIAHYLKRWCKANLDDTQKPLAVEIKLQQSAFGLGLMYDRLVLSMEDRYTHRFGVTPTIVLALVEGVLGYERVSVDGTIWTYRRARELAI
ncbi:hypothetical protein NKR23_g4788 [Pleurostoma richardsiae]|uniref:Uncharacterized protein n=1 Tax=Pleurostoma richardsiae TaxID=41990 RepID=A0AA38S3K8_9PEZI|nr:hypothetical protein NKR23_g4788 [Pleurostoma richardsiae]